jgi:23S rRNA pseudouridine1911/1915/1917 synthase
MPPSSSKISAINLDPLSDPITGPRVLVPEQPAIGGRLDKVLSDLCPDLSRVRVQALIADQRVNLIGPPERVIADGNYRVKPGDQFILNLPEAVDPLPKGEDIGLKIVFEDAHLIVIDKPAGLVVHPAPGHAAGTLVNALIAHCGESLKGIGGVKRPGIVHRLDKDTSGLLVAAKTDKAMAGMTALFAEHDLTRAYQALVRGRPAQPQGIIDLPIGRSNVNRQKMAVLAEGGREARTHYTLVESFGPEDKPIASLMRLELETGRTHQIRVHLSHLGLPVLGDPVYAKAKRLISGPPAVKAAVEAFPRQALHAVHLGFKHPVTGKMLKFNSPLPDDMAALLAVLRSV